MHTTLKFWTLYSTQRNPHGLMSAIEAQHVVIIIIPYLKLQFEHLNSQALVLEERVVLVFLI